MTQVPEDERSLGLVWKHSLGGYSDSLGVFLPGYTCMKTSKDKPKEGVAEYTREVIRVNESSYLRRWVSDHPQAAMKPALTHIHELNSIVSYMKDEIERQQGTLSVPKVRSEMVAKAVNERNYWKSLHTDEEHQRKLVEGRLSTKELEMGLLQKKINEANERIAFLEAEAAKTMSEQVASRFLTSTAFREVVAVSSMGVVKAKIHEELAKVARYYPFSPDKFGFVLVPSEQARPQNLPDYSGMWQMML